MDSVFYSCEEHVDCVIDDFLNLYNETPNVDLLYSYDEKYCKYCNEYAKYIVSFIKL